MSLNYTAIYMRMFDGSVTKSLCFLFSFRCSLMGYFCFFFFLVPFSSFFFCFGVFSIFVCSDFFFFSGETRMFDGCLGNYCLGLPFVQWWA